MEVFGVDRDLQAPFSLFNVLLFATKARKMKKPVRYFDNHKQTIKYVRMRKFIIINKKRLIHL